MNDEPLYTHRESADDLGKYFTRHLSAMTGEDLHSKGDIAAELAWRDREIDLLLAENAEARNMLRLADAAFRAALEREDTLLAEVETRTNSLLTLDEKHADLRAEVEALREPTTAEIDDLSPPELRAGIAVQRRYIDSLRAELELSRPKVGSNDGFGGI